MNRKQILKTSYWLGLKTVRNGVAIDINASLDWFAFAGFAEHFKVMGTSGIEQLKREISKAYRDGYNQKDRNDLAIKIN